MAVHVNNFVRSLFKSLTVKKYAIACGLGFLYLPNSHADIFKKLYSSYNQWTHLLLLRLTMILLSIQLSMSLFKTDLLCTDGMVRRTAVEQVSQEKIVLGIMITLARILSILHHLFGTDFGLRWICTDNWSMKFLQSNPNLKRKGVLLGSFEFRHGKISFLFAG